MLRVVRAAVFTALCVTLSAGTHVLLSAAPVPLVPLLGIAFTVFLAAYALAGRERGYGSIAALLLPLQLAADTVFTLGQQTCYGPAGGPVLGPLRAMGIHLLCAGGEFGAPLTVLTADQPAPAGPGGSLTTLWLLLAGHLGMGLVAAAWLWRGEAALGRLLRAAAADALVPVRPLPRALPLGTGDGVPRLVVPTLRTRPTALVLLLHSVVLRGPPRQAALCG